MYALLATLCWITWIATIQAGDDDSLGKTALLPNFDSISIIDFPRPDQKSVTRVESAVPDSCAKDKACKATMEVWSMTFEDCGDPWTLCRCSTATSAAVDVLEAVSRIPVAVRRLVGTFLVFDDPTTPSNHAWTMNGQDISIFNQPRYMAYLHEVIHAYCVLTRANMFWSKGNAYCWMAAGSIA